MGNAIETWSLRRAFGRKEAVHDLTLAVPEGSVFALLGPNGAGKTTTIQMLVNLLRPGGGRAEVMGVDSTRLGPRELALLGYVSENQRLPGWMTVGGLLDYCAPLYPTWDQGLAAQLLRQLRLPSAAKIRSLSRGMRIKAALACSLAYRPRLLMLDEPFGGLDPLVRDELAAGILELAGGESWTVFLASHDVEEVERLTDRVAFLEDGRLRLAEPVADLQARFRRVEVVLPEDAGPPPMLPPEWRLAETVLRTFRFVDSAYREGETEARVQALLPGCGHLAVAPLSLREIFLALARDPLPGAGREEAGA